MIVAAGSFDHLVAMSDDLGTFEHARHSTPRRHEGYCTDDMARVLVVASRQPAPTRSTTDLAQLAFRFVCAAQGVDGRIRNRCSARGRWSGRRGVDDCWGRSLWAFGTAVRRQPAEWMRQSSRAYFDRGAQQRSPHLRSMVFAGLGAAEVLAVLPQHAPARRLLADAVAMIGPAGPSPEWPWPEARLSYADAAVCEVLIAGGQLLDRPADLERGLVLLDWLLARQTVGDHLSPTPVGGGGPCDVAPSFDQQPIEVSALADACATAWRLTGDVAWLVGLERCSAWFLGANDAGAVMWDPRTGGGYDGLERLGANQNQGAESTLAFVATMQLARACRSSAPAGPRP